MGFYKLREWVGTVTGKGGRWGRDRLGRSAPAFLSANTTALPPPTCTARREAGRRWSAAVVFAARLANCWSLCFEACAGRRIRWLCPPAVPVLWAVCLLPPFACHAHCPHQRSCPHSSLLFPVLFILLLCSPVHCHVRQDRFQPNQHVCKLLDCPVGSCNTGLQWRPVRRVHLTISSFSCRVHDPGPWV